MKRLLPYPAMIIALIIMWLLLTRWSLGQFLLGTAVALIAAQGVAALHPPKPHWRRWDLLPRLFLIVFHDIVRSNIAVANIILRGAHRKRRSGFITINLDLRDKTGLAVLSLIITSTPGTAWIDYNSARDTLLVHVFDLVDENAWYELIKNRYEYLLLEIFE